MQCCMNYSAVIYTSWWSVGPHIFIYITTNVFSCDAARKESFSVLSSLCCDVITRCIQKAHLCTWLEITSISTLRKMLNGVKEWGVEWEERHQLPLVGRKPLLQTITYVGNSSPIWPSLVRGWDCNIVLFALAICMLASWWYIRFTFVLEKSRFTWDQFANETDSEKRKKMENV